MGHLPRPRCNACVKIPPLANTGSRGQGVPRAGHHGKAAGLAPGPRTRFEARKGARKEQWKCKSTPQRSSRLGREGRRPEVPGGVTTPRPTRPGGRDKRGDGHGLLAVGAYRHERRGVPFERVYPAVAEAVRREIFWGAEFVTAAMARLPHEVAAGQAPPGQRVQNKGEPRPAPNPASRSF